MSTVEAFLKMRNPYENRYAFEYYGCKYTWKQLWDELDLAAKVLKALGFQEEYGRYRIHYREWKFVS